MGQLQVTDDVRDQCCERRGIKQQWQFRRQGIFEQEIETRPRH